MIAAWVALALTVGVVVCHYFNGDEWNYFFGVAFFAGLPFAGLIEDGLGIALWGYSFGVALLIGLTLFAYVMEYTYSGNWEAGV